MLKANRFFEKTLRISQIIGRMLLWIALSRLRVLTVCGLCGKREEIRCFVPEVLLKCLMYGLTLYSRVDTNLTYSVVNFVRKPTFR